MHPDPSHGPSRDTLIAKLARLTSASIQGDYNPHTRFEWPASLPDAAWWMSPQLLSVYDTPLMRELEEPQLQRLSKWESLNFYSLNIHGIRELMIEVARRLHTPGYELFAEFFHRFLGEENDHMWFFAEFCLRYGKIYPDKSVKLERADDGHSAEAENFLIFSRILMFEEIVDYFNTRMGKDESLPPLIRHINAVHHEDESRHIAGGRQIVATLFDRLAAKVSLAQLAQIGAYLKTYLTASVESLYNPGAYRDAGVPDAYRHRRELPQLPARKPHHQAFTQRTVKFFSQLDGIIEKEFTP
jgi:hypothetical protein